MSEPMSKFLKWTRFCDCGRPIAGIIVDAAGNTVEAHKNEGLWVVETPRGAQLVNLRPLGGGEFVAEAERPKPKFCINCWAAILNLGNDLPGVLVSGPEWSERFGCWEYIQRAPNGAINIITELQLRPCAPVCTEAQLAIRVGDEVRVSNSWDTNGVRNCMDRLTTKILTVRCIQRHDPSSPIEVLFANWGGSTWLWNLEPIRTRVI